MLRVLVVMMFVGLAGCGGCDGDAAPAGPRTEILDPGTGDPNVEPLWPVRPGAVYSSGAPQQNTNAWYVTEPVEIDGISVLRVVNEDRTTGFATPAPAEPAAVKYLSREDDGSVLYRGQLREGMFAAPVLLVPAEVRLGMKWISRTDTNEARFMFEVIDVKRQTLTRWGTRTSWTIAITDYAIRSINPMSDGSQYTVTYVEGRGPADVLPFNQAQSISQTVIPLEDPVLPVRTAPIVTLRPSGGGEPFIADFFPQHIAFIDDPQRWGDVLYAYAFGAITMLEGIGPDGKVHYADQPYAACSLASSTSFTAPPERYCYDGTAAYVSADGTFDTIPMNVDGRVLGPTSGCTGGETCTYLNMFGIDAATDGSVQVGAYAANRSYFGAIDRTKTTDNIDNTKLIQVNHLFSRLRTAPFIQPIHYDAAGIAVGVPLHGALAFGRIGTDGVEHDTHVALRNDGGWSATARPGVHDWLRTTLDGHVDRLVFGERGITLEPVADLELPPDSFAVGTAIHGDKLVVALELHYRGYDIEALPEGDDTVMPEFGDLYLYEGTLPPPGPTYTPLPVVAAVAIDSSVRVCWPPDAGPPDLASWTIAGQSPLFVVPAGTDNDCVLIVPQNGAAVGVNPDDRTVEGVVPGLGRVAVTVVAESSTTYEEPELGGLMLPNTTIAPLAGGGFVTDTFVYGSGATLAHSHGTVERSIPAPYADLGGAGIWGVGVSVAWNDTVVLEGAYRRTLTVPGTGTLTVGVHPVYGAGIVVSRGGVELGVLHPDGSIATLPAHTDLNVMFVYPDGTVCGTLTSDGTTLRCRNPAGTDIVNGVYDCAPLGFGKNKRIYGLNAGSLCVTDLSGATAITQSVTLSQYGFRNGPAINFAQGTDGKAYLYQSSPPMVFGGAYQHIAIDLDNATTSTFNVFGYLAQQLEQVSSLRIIVEDKMLTVAPSALQGTMPLIRAPR